MRSGALPALLLGSVVAACGSSSHGPGASPSPGDDGGGNGDAGAEASSPDAADASAAPDAGDTGPFPLGATWGADAVHFRVRADAATALELDVYAASLGADEVARYP